jgi:histidinol-phosphate aminotransferase
MPPTRPAKLKPADLVRPLVRDLHGYVPGEQPRIRDLVKLNTNENPYPPAPSVLRAVRAATDGRLRLYPQPAADGLRAQLAGLHGCRPENLIVTNGSDELLALATRCFVEPQPGRSRRARPAREDSRSTIQWFHPSYSLYPVLARIHGARANAVPLRPDFTLPDFTALRREGRWDFDAALTFITTPNAPSGRAYATADLEPLVAAQRGVVVLDEAYVDFAEDCALVHALQYPNVLVARTFSKAYSLCFQRVGYAIGHPVLIEALHKIRDSYNVNGLGQVAAAATLEALPYYRRNFARIIATRDRVTQSLASLGFETLPSQTNFILTRPPRFPASRWLHLLRRRQILVRWFATPEINAFLRVSIGSDPEMDAFLDAVRAILKTRLP